MNKPKFSIIVPCYNVGQFIDECVDSIEKQTFTDYELILINDGSRDNSLSLCNERAKKNERIRVIDKKNEGLSVTRNKGIKEANGDFIVFVDGDDYIESNSLEEFNRAIDERTEIVITRLIKDFVDSREYEDERMEDYFSAKNSLQDAVLWVMTETSDTWPSVKYVVSKSFIEKNNIAFLEGYLHEDFDWTTRIFAKAKYINACYLPWYHYRMKREGSITNVVSAKHITDVIAIAHNLLEGERSVLLDYPEEIRETVKRRVMISAFQALGKYKLLADETEKNRVIECAQAHNKIFDYCPKTRFKVLMTAVKLLGYRPALELYSKLF